MAVLPTATIDDMPRKMPMEAYARVSLGPVRWISVRGHLEGCLANLWRRTRRYCRSTRHVDTRPLRPPCIGSGGRSCKDESRITHELADCKNISRVETDAREAAKTIDTIWGANSDSFLAQTDALNYGILRLQCDMMISSGSAMIGPNPREECRNQALPQARRRHSM